MEGGMPGEGGGIVGSLGNPQRGPRRISAIRVR